MSLTPLRGSNAWTTFSPVWALFCGLQHMDALWRYTIKKEIEMGAIFPAPIRNLPEADIPLSGIKAFLSQAENHQIIFMEFAEDVDLPEHSHAAQVGIVIEGKIDLTFDDELKTYGKGDIYYIPVGTKHSGKIYAGYADITFFDEPHRYMQKQPGNA